MGEIVERLRRLSPKLDMLACEDVLQAADRIEALERELAEARCDNADIQEEITALENARLQAEAREAVLVAAARPFAAYADLIDDNPITRPFADRCPLALDPDHEHHNHPTLGDLRSLYKALSTAPERTKLLLDVVEAARKGPCRHEASIGSLGCPMCQALAALDRDGGAT